MAYDRYLDDLKEAHYNKTPPPTRPSWLAVKRGKKTDAVANLRAPIADKDSIVSASPDPEALSTGLGNYSMVTLDNWAEMYDISNPHGFIRPHKVAAIEGAFVGRQVGWSPGGEWCVVVGNNNRALIYQRWAKDNKVSTPGHSVV